MNFICKVLFTTPFCNDGDVRSIKWMNTKPDSAIRKTRKKYPNCEIVDTVCYEPRFKKPCPPPPDNFVYTSFATVLSGPRGNRRYKEMKREDSNE